MPTLVPHPTRIRAAEVRADIDLEPAAAPGAGRGSPGRDLFYGR